ncbi:MAG: hypothetical protein SFV55_20325 [Haliscomenobacter sp.]|uniref:CIS tube protein n=1 Tax=Haliscomenobacter sp. TaxID=2717303 RepID=UPI0029A85776|nr:hypothetical protein [Haliscomenobacter sp.]MDX2070787.1 hypothetical protein [Haliscomenobacter sp.]
MTNGSIEKVRIFAYTDKRLTTPNAAVPQPFYLPMNPESYSKNFKIETDNRRGHGNEGTDPRYNSTAPEELKLDFIFDGTDTIENYRYTDPSDKSVKKQLELFMKTVYQMAGNIHRPNFLKVHWGEYLVFPCILSNLDINYQLFESNGDPLRIKISATFLNYIAQEERTARERQSSPDLTHLRLAKAGDRLDLMTHKIYNDTKYMLQVARVNNLVSLRVLKPGKEMRFPPLDKTEKV